MRKFIRASVLVIALAVPAFAGNIPYGVTGDIPNGATADGEIQNGVTGNIPYGVTSQPLIDALLALLSLI
jgi:16S rRNA A1518/A1519 N6-dimethyltransferase RsmA/KsgA/DIM1 with predicted DNA glycosylase/AP lyase activity